MNISGKASIVSAVTATAVLTAGFLSLQFLRPSPRFLAGRPEALEEGVPALRGPKDHPVFVVRNGGRIFSLDPLCPPAGGTTGSPSCRLAWKTPENALACPCDPGATFDAEGRSIAPGKPSLLRHRTTLGPNGEVLVDRSIAFAEKDWIKPGAELFLVPPVPADGGM